MSRIRTIKPESALSETLESVSITAALLFARLPCFADDEGRMRYSPARIKAQVFPLRDEITRDDCGAAIEELCARNLVKVYKVDGREYLHITGFEEHQKVNRPAASVFPSPEEAESPDEAVEDPEIPSVDSAAQKPSKNVDDAGETLEFTEYSLNTHGTFSEYSLTEKEKEKEGKRKRKGREGEEDHCEDRIAGGSADMTARPYAYRCLDVFNRVTGQSWTELKPEIARWLSRFEGVFSVDEVAVMIEFKRRQWKDNPKMKRYIRPKTLFSSDHFEEYIRESKEEAESNAEHQFDEYDD